MRIIGIDPGQSGVSVLVKRMTTIGQSVGGQVTKLREVERIYLDWRGICHIVASERTGWVYTLCNTLQSGESSTRWPLKSRICRECRKRLKTAEQMKSAKPIQPDNRGDS